MRDIIILLITLVLIILISILPKLSNKNKFKIKLAVSGMVNKILIFAIVCLAALENKIVGLLLLILTFCALNLNITKSNHIEGFKNYYKAY
tara:strand:+ start:62 stop:334 length:273 start_codon:yes stop_codon:yes gene_type:complete